MEPRTRPPDRKEQLVAVAAELFCARGFHEVGINDIAAAAGITGPALYRHFSDKQAILSHVVLSGIDELTKTTTDALQAADAPTPAQLDDLLCMLAALAVDKRAAAALWRGQRRDLDAAGRHLVRQRSATLIDRWAATLRVGRPDVDAADAQLLALAALSVYASVAVHSTRIGKRRYVTLLAEAARSVLHTRLPDATTQDTPPAGDAAVVQPSRRELLLTEASRLFQQHGFHDVSMDDIGTAAGIAGPSVYRHFPSKAAIFMAAANRIAERLELGRASVAATASTATEALHGLVDSYVETMRTSADLLAVGRQISALSTQQRAHLRRVQRGYVAEWTRLLGDVRPRLTPAEARVVVHMALTIANDLLHTGRARSRPNADAELAALMVSALGI